MSMLPFGLPGRLYKGNLHTHSTVSDGGLSPAGIVEHYREGGYDFVAITDHFLPEYGYPITETSGLGDDAFTALPGAELHAPATSLGPPWHIVAVGLPPGFSATGAEETGPQVAARAAAAGAFVVLAHPEGSSLTVEDAQSIPAAHAVEVHNATGAWRDGRPGGAYLLDALMARGRRISAVAADDAHFGARRDSRLAWVMVRARSAAPDALVAALRAGHHYSSEGPQLHDVAIDGSRLRVRCSPVDGIFVTGSAGQVEWTRGDGLVEHDVALAPFGDGALRVTVVDHAGARAWTNPVWP